MSDVHIENAREVLRVQNQQPIETLRANRPDKALRDAVRLWRLNRCSDDPNPSTLKQLIEAVRKFAVVVANQHPHRLSAVEQRPCDLPRT